MSKSVKIIALVLTVVVVLGAVTGIAFWTAQYNPEDLAPGLYVDGARVEPAPAMFTVGGQDVPFTIYRHYFLLYKAYFEEQYGPDLYAEDPDGDSLYTLKRSTELDIVNAYNWASFAKELGIELDEADLTELDATLAEQKETFGADFASQLADMRYLDEANYMEVARLQKLMDKTEEAYRAQQEEENAAAWGEEADAAFAEEKLRAKHILINYDQAAQDVVAAQEAALEKAEGILADIRAEQEAGEDLEAAFDKAMTEFSEDPGLAQNPDGYVFGPGEMVDVFYNTTLSMEIGEVSEPVLSEAANYGGYHIILRLAPTEEDKALYRTQAIEGKIEAAVADKQQEMQGSIPVSYPDFYYSLTADSIQ